MCFQIKLQLEKFVNIQSQIREASLNSNFKWTRSSKIMGVSLTANKPILIKTSQWTLTKDFSWTFTYTHIIVFSYKGREMGIDSNETKRKGWKDTNETT
jgi:hypothetical protein